MCAMPHDHTLPPLQLSCFRLDLTERIAHLVLNRPEALNTLNPMFWHELDLVLDTLHRGGQARALVISSTGKHFSAGMALDTLPTLSSRPMTAAPKAAPRSSTRWPACRAPSTASKSCACP